MEDSEYEIVAEFFTENEAKNYIENKTNKERDSLYITMDMFDGRYEVVRIR